MTPETLEFCKMFFQSPIVGTLAGGLLGFLASFSATWFKSRHDSKESEKKWQREEERRKEERAFSNKHLAYEGFYSCFGNNFTPDSILPHLVRMAFYGSEEVKYQAREMIVHLGNLKKIDPNSQYYHEYLKNIENCSTQLYMAMNKDIDQHLGLK